VISEFMLNILFNLVSGMLSILPDISWNVDLSVLQPFFDLISVACYLLPMPTVFAIVTLVLSLTVFRIIISIVKTVWASAVCVIHTTIHTVMVNFTFPPNGATLTKKRRKPFRLSSLFIVSLPFNIPQHPNAGVFSTRRL